MSIKEATLALMRARLEFVRKHPDLKAKIVDPMRLYPIREIEADVLEPTLVRFDGMNLTAEPYSACGAPLSVPPVLPAPNKPLPMVPQKRRRDAMSAQQALQMKIDMAQAILNFDPTKDDSVYSVFPFLKIVESEE